MSWERKLKYTYFFLASSPITLFCHHAVPSSLSIQFHSLQNFFNLEIICFTFFFPETPERTSESELSDLLLHQQIMQSQPSAETENTQRGYFRSFSHPGVLNARVQMGRSNSSCNPLHCVDSPKPNKQSRRGYSKSFVTFLIET